MTSATTLIPVPLDAGPAVDEAPAAPPERVPTTDRGRAEGPRVRQVSRPVTALAARALLGATSRCTLPGVHEFARRVGDRVCEVWSATAPQLRLVDGELGDRQVQLEGAG